MLNQAKSEIIEILRSFGVNGSVVLVVPPKPEMGDVSFGCFGIAKERGVNPAVVAAELAKTIVPLKIGLIAKVEAVGPYLNFWLDDAKVTSLILGEMDKAGNAYGKHRAGANQKILVEFAHPNTHKAFHIGHMRNIVTGESIARILENSGYEIHRINYQGDVGMHIAKCLWGIGELSAEYETAKIQTRSEQAAFLGKAYALGSRMFEENESTKNAVYTLNDKIYSHDPEIAEVYETTRRWSLEYFEKNIYARIGTEFERLYFESEVYERGLELVNEFLEKGVFKKSDGAIIFAGSECGLHDRVFVNGKGFPTYEGKEVALAELQFNEYHPDKIIHITGAEQADYFKVIFAAIAEVFPETAEKEKHITYGWVRLKEGKMSSRAGTVVLGEWLLDEVEKKIAEIMVPAQIQDKENIIKKIGLAAVKYAFLKVGVGSDIAFDLGESISVHGDSGPYLLYIAARIKSIMRKSGGAGERFSGEIPSLFLAERSLIYALGDFPAVTETAAAEYDPSKIANYLLEVAQIFNTFYHDCPILSADADTRDFRLSLIRRVELVIERGLQLLGIETVEEM